MATIMLKDFAAGSSTSCSRPAAGSSRRPRSSSSSASARPASGRSRWTRRTSSPGWTSPRGRRRHHRHRTGQDRPLQRARGPRPWAVTRPASSASGSPERGRLGRRDERGRPDRTSWSSPRPATASASADEFRRKHRGGQGVGLISLEGRKTGGVAAVQQVTDEDEELVLISAGGQVVRTETNTINRYSSSGPRRHRDAPRRGRPRRRRSPLSAPDLRSGTTSATMTTPGRRSRPVTPGSGA